MPHSDDARRNLPGTQLPISPDSSEQQLQPNSRKRLLVADDNEDLLDLFTVVANMEGCDVVTATDGAQAVEKASLNRPDLIFMDLRMPVMDGYEATRRILSTPQLSKIPIIAISAHCEGEWERRARAAGCAECVKKPVHPTQLHDVIERYLGTH